VISQCLFRICSCAKVILVLNWPTYAILLTGFLARTEADSCPIRQFVGRVPYDEIALVQARLDFRVRRIAMGYLNFPMARPLFILHCKDTPLRSAAEERGNGHFQDVGALPGTPDPR
jgi:hypothetical protein